MKIIIDTVPHDQQRYDTVGDYWRDSDGTLHIRVSEMSDPRHVLLVALHELVECALVEKRGITMEAIDHFDMSHPELDDPGSDPQAPYHAEHMIALEIERRIADELGVDWNYYENEVFMLGSQWRPGQLSVTSRNERVEAFLNEPESTHLFFTE